jgi:hypothetical protein
MSTSILVLTAIMLAIPVVLSVAAVFVDRRLALAPSLMWAIYVWVWLRFRPREFDVHADRVEIVWPLRRESIPRAVIASVRIMDARELRRELGLALRIGAGGLWGGFGWLWTRQRGVVRMYVSRIDRFVWIETTRGRPWLLTPERPDDFVRSVAHPH